MRLSYELGRFDEANETVAMMRKVAPHYRARDLRRGRLTRDEDAISAAAQTFRVLARARPDALRAAPACC